MLGAEPLTRPNRAAPTRPGDAAVVPFDHPAPPARVAALLAALVLSLAWAGIARAEVSVGDPELDRLFTGFVEGRGEASSDALDALATSGREDARALLTGILEGTLMLHKKEQNIVRVEKRGREVEMFHALSGESLGTDRKRALKRLRLDNRLRSHLRDLIAGLGLRSASVAERRLALEALLDRPEAIEADTLVALADEETEPELRALIERVQARQFLADEDPTVRLAGVASLERDLSPATRRALADLAREESDETVRERALAAIASQARTLDLYGHAETLFFGLSLGSVLACSRRSAWRSPSA